MPTFSRNGVPLYYHILDKNQSNAPPLILTHGFGATSHLWQEQVQAWSEHYRVVVWELRGHGRSGSPEQESDYDEKECVADMKALLDHLGAEDAFFGGQGLGGYLSLRFHVEHPHRVAGLLLLDAGPGFLSSSSREAWNESAHAQALAFETYGFQVLESQDRAHGGLHQAPKGLALAARGMLIQKDDRVIRSLSRIRVPCLIMVGEQDEVFRKAANYLRLKVPNAQLVVIPRAGLFSNLDQPQGVNHAGKNFLKRYSGQVEESAKRGRRKQRAVR